MDSCEVVAFHAVEVISKNLVDQSRLAGLHACAKLGDIIGLVICAAGVLFGFQTEAGLEEDFFQFAAVRPAFTAVQAIWSTLVLGIEDVFTIQCKFSLFHFFKLLSACPLWGVSLSCLRDYLTTFVRLCQPLFAKKIKKIF